MFYLSLQTKPIAMNRFYITTLLLSAVATTFAQGPWKINLKDSKENVELHLDLYGESIEVPGMEMFGPLNGYLGGDIYRTWAITSFKIKDDKTARIKVSNDLGSETQEIEIKQKNDSVWSVDLLGRNVVKRVKGKKLVKAPSSFQMQKMR